MELVLISIPTCANDVGGERTINKRRERGRLFFFLFQQSIDIRQLQSMKMHLDRELPS